jgi:nitrate reductase gamma subunit
MNISVGGKAVAFTGLSAAMPMITVPAGVTGDIVVSFGLPHGTFVLVTVIAGLLMLIALCVLAIRQRTSQI